MGNPAADVLKKSKIPAGLNVFRASALVTQSIALPGEISQAFPRLKISTGRALACRGPAGVSVALRLAASACPDGKWTAIISSAEVDAPLINPAAAREAGVALERALWVRVTDAASAAAMCLDSCAVVLVHGALVAREAQRLQARAANASTTLIFICAEDARAVDADVVFATSDAHWDGLLAGYGHLMHRDITLSVHARHGQPMSPEPVRLHGIHEQKPHNVPEYT